MPRAPNRQAAPTARLLSGRKQQIRNSRSEAVRRLWPKHDSDEEAEAEDEEEEEEEEEDEPKPEPPARVCSTTSPAGD